MLNRSNRLLVPGLALAVSLAMGPATTAHAEGIDYTYVELGYVTTDLDGIGTDLDGFVLRGSFEVTDNWFLYARYLDQGVSVGGVDFDAKQYGLGGGYAWSFADNMDLYGRIGYTEVELDASGGGFGGVSVDDDGYELGVGIRARPTELLELEGAVNYVDLSDAGDDTSFGVAARWFITDVFALGVEGEFADDAETYGVALRLQF